MILMTFYFNADSVTNTKICKEYRVVKNTARLVDFVFECCHFESHRDDRDCRNYLASTRTALTEQTSPAVGGTVQCGFKWGRTEDVCTQLVQGDRVRCLPAISRVDLYNVEL